MAKTFIDLTGLARKAGLTLSVSVSMDLTEARYSLDNGDSEEFESACETYRWLDGYVRGRQTESGGRRSS